MDFNKKKSNAIKVLVVDDSAFMRKVLSDIIESDISLTVIGTATDGKDALNKIDLLNPDVITLDVEMPVMDGINCLKEIMNKSPKPVIMISSGTSYGAELTIKALDEGAVDFIAKPKNIFDIKNEKVRNEIIEKITVAHNYGKKNYKIHNSYISDKAVKSNATLKYIIAIGCSTGGPKALQSIIPYLPENLPAAVLVVQHMPPGFTNTLAERLDAKSKVVVREATNKEKLLAGHVYIAPGDYHMLLETSANGDILINLDKSPPVGGHRPSVDVMMTSLSDTGFKNIIGVILTGMGSDGSIGVKKLKEINKGFIIAQDEESCVVYGMPKMAFQTGAVDKVVSLSKITDEIIQFLEVR
ncbi:chemotaxis response regulator protein-glutamate methylesterase [Ruminiclostridium herbifermentans]|uniref:Protein-glutamate methylesterase/protein-glutamine glutaminase n=1 Tax=Ruminiclostridium herbifermentans TaxID=2488810 RepID=A0A4V6EQ65_9FIRM|nr:chemotaxis response regulator protein-glutamate methylesterase [Ruminiclostridium herbifermentans]QNU68407.1 chemotaxis response regulator protein-glutamate methylesterase [Ruminiclostridium herbifermentans]